MIPPILITGAARSGTSMVAGIIELSGAFGGETTEGSIFNPKGYFENGDIRDFLSKPYLAEIGFDPMAQADLPGLEVMTPQDYWKEAVEDTMIRQGYRSGPWYYKGAKMCILWPVWTSAFPEAKWVIVRRDDDEIIDSCLRTRFMHAFSDREGWQSWLDIHKERFEQLKANANCIEFWPKTILSGDTKPLKDLLGFLGLEFNEEVVSQFVDTSLWNRTEIKENS